MALKYFPVLMTLVMVNHCIWGLFGYDLKIAENTVTMQFVPTILMILVSKSYGFCRLHNTFIMYVLLASIATHYHNVYGFKHHLFEHHILFIVIGMALLVLLFFKRNKFNRYCGYDKEVIEQGTT